MKKKIQTINVKNATRKTKKLDAIIPNDVSVLIKASDKDNTLFPEVHLNDKLKAPIKKDDVIGTVTYNVEGLEYTYLYIYIWNQKRKEKEIEDWRKELLDKNNSGLFWCQTI